MTNQEMSDVSFEHTLELLEKNPFLNHEHKT